MEENEWASELERAREKERERDPELLHLKSAIAAYYGNPFLTDHLLLKTKLVLIEPPKNRTLRIL